MFNIELEDKQPPQVFQQRKVYSGLRTGRDYTMSDHDNLQRNYSKDKENLEANIENNHR